MSGVGSFTALARTCIPRPLRNLLRSPRGTARWLRHEGEYLLGRRPALAMRPDWTLRAHPVSLASFARSADDADLVAELDGFIAHCSPGMRLLDIGANYGLFCLATLRYGEPHARVVAVDPSPTSNRILRHNLKLAGADGRVTVVEAAVGAADGVLSMLTTGPAGDHYLVAASGARADAKSVRQYAIPSLVALTGVDPTHLKIDVEGFEDEVIDGAAPWLARSGPIVFLELHGDMLRGKGQKPTEVLSRLADCGYTRFLRNGRPIEPTEAAALPIARLVCLPAGRR